MKKFSLLVLLSLGFAFQMNAQAPQAIPYQAVARDTTGHLMSNQNISVRFSIHDATASGTVVYSETRSATTNALGLFSLNIGQANAFFGNVDWSSGFKFLQVEMDAAGGTNFIDMGTQQLFSVPYALFAATTGSSINNQWTTSDSNVYNNNTGNIGIGTSSPSSPLSVQGSSNSDQISIFQNANTTHGWGFFGNSSDGSLNFDRFGPHAGPKITILDAGNVGIGTTTPGQKLDVNGTTKTTNFIMTNGATNGAVLTSDSSGNASWQPASAVQSISFLAKEPGVITVNPGGASTPIPYHTEYYDDENGTAANNYNNSTGVFTVPVAGKYHFDASVDWPYSSNIIIVLDLTVNGTSVSAAYNYVSYSDSQHLSTDLKLNAGDQVQVKVSHSSASAQHVGYFDYFNVFSGHLFH
ncbi:MAG TPA: hypothetical protein VE978_12750 [Chitinophagales bacterium]|nr:hypothetical protein [Chitinophagales bacterium]